MSLGGNMDSMASISELYGADYQEQADSARQARLCDVIASNIAGLNFQMRYNFAPLFLRGQMSSALVEQICEKICRLNPKLIPLPISSMEARTMLPYLVKMPALYLRILDTDRRKIYLLYISPENMEAY